MKFINSFKKAVFLVAVLNLIFFFIEFIVALNIRSVSLLADSIDFIEDTSINFLIFFAISLSLEKSKDKYFVINNNVITWFCCHMGYLETNNFTATTNQ